ncbi:MAG TPA: DUF2232 domain-containing protein [Candidatus Binatia bacterium]
MQRLEVIGRFFLAFASSVLVLMSGVVLPPIGVILLPLVPLPVLSFGLRYGRGSVVAGTIGVTLLFFIFAGEELAFIYGLFALMTILLLAFLGRVRLIERLVTGIAAALFAVSGALLFSYFGSWNAVGESFRANLLQHLTAAARLYEKMGFPQESLDLLQERTPQIVAMMLQLLPGLVFVSISLVVLANVLLLCRRFPENRAQWISVANLREWNGPEPMVWGLIACGFVLMIPGLEGLRVLGANVLLVIAAFYFAQGLSIIAYFFHKNNVPRFLRAVTYGLIAFEQIFTVLVVGLGLFDLWGDFRRLKKNNLNPSQAS